MPVPTLLTDLSVTAASNSPAGVDVVASNSGPDDYIRALSAILRTTNAKGSDIASATTTDIGAATSEFVDVTGTTTITGLGTIAAGIVRTVRFTGALILTYNATSLILPSSANITTAAGDTAIFRSLGSGNWVCIAFVRRSGQALVATSDATKANLAGSSSQDFSIQTLTLTNDLAVTEGGTGASTAAGALSNLGAAGQGKQTIWVPAGAMTSRTTNGAGSTTSERTTNKNMVKTLDFDTATQEFAQFDVIIPKSGDDSTVTFQPYWTAASGSGGVVWGLQAVATRDDDATDVAFGTAQTSTDTFIAANDCHIGSESSAITIAGTLTFPYRVNFQINRTVADGSDTLGVDASLIGVAVFYTTNLVNDA